jgi:hypothetical protein
MDTFRTVTRKSWISRVGSSIAGTIFGFIAVLALPFLLFWNEGRSVQTARSLDEGLGIVIGADAARIDPQNEGRLIHVSAPLEIAGEVSDSLSGMSAKAVRLDRVIEMYQWVERCESSSKTTVGGAEETVTTCNYTKEWKDSPVSSAGFKRPAGHQNPAWSLQPQSFNIPSAQLGAFTAGSKVLGQLGDTETLPATQSALEQAKSQLGGARPLSLLDGSIYAASDPLAPQVGDLRISYRIVPGGVISAVAKQTGAELAQYQTQAGDSLLLVGRGNQPAGAMFQKAHEENAFLTWVLRAVGIGGLFIGFALLLGPIATIADVLPPVGAIIRLGTGSAALVLALLLGGFAIGVAWLWYRPLIGLAVLAATGGLVWALMRRGPARGAPAPSPAVRG